VRGYRLDRPALRAAARRIVPAGISSKALPRRYALADELGRPLAEFSGSHSDFIPEPFATRLRDILAEQGRESSGIGAAELSRSSVWSGP